MLQYKVDIKNSFVDFKGPIYRIGQPILNLVEDENYSSNFFFKKLIRGKTKFLNEKNLFVLHDSWSNGYFHWIIDVLFKLYLVKSDIIGMNIILPKNLIQFQLRSLELFPTINIIGLESWENAFCKKLSYVNFPLQSGVYDDSLYLAYRDWLLELIMSNSAFPIEVATNEFLYIDRQSDALRKVSNFDELHPFLLENNFKVAQLLKVDFFEQVAMFTKAHTIMGAHGAGLVNMIFMESGSTVVELRNSYPDGNNCFERLAKVFKHKYVPIYKKREDYNGDFQNSDVYANIDEIKSLFK